MVTEDVKTAEVGEDAVVIKSVRIEVVSPDVVIEVVLVGREIVTGTEVG